MSKDKELEPLRPAEMALLGIRDVDLKAEVQPKKNERAKRLALCLDGPWGGGGVPANPARIAQLIAPADSEDTEQHVYYSPGISTEWSSRLLGGAFGRNPSQAICQAYTWLARTYAEPDEVFLFGFSQGASVARSLVAFIRYCGLLQVNEGTRKDSFASMVTTAYNFYREWSTGAGEGLSGEAAQAFRRAHSLEIRIRFVGLWETVGPLGVPSSKFNLFVRRHRFHDSRLSRIVDHAYHALAVDEHRRDFEPALWTNGRDTEPGQREQRWFVGNHANVGGSHHEQDPLSTIPLRWIQLRAINCGLAMKEKVKVEGDAHLAPIAESGSARYHRKIGQTTNETIDESVMRRWSELRSYRPRSLAEYLETQGHMEKEV